MRGIKQINVLAVRREYIASLCDASIAATMTTTYAAGVPGAAPFAGGGFPGAPHSFGTVAPPAGFPGMNFPVTPAPSVPGGLNIPGIFNGGTMRDNRFMDQVKTKLIRKKNTRKAGNKGIMHK